MKQKQSGARLETEIRSGAALQQTELVMESRRLFA